MDFVYPGLDPATLAIGDRLAERIGREKVALIIQQFVRQYSEATERKVRGEEMPAQVPLRVDVDFDKSPENIELMQDLLGSLLRTAMQRVYEQN